MRKALLQLVADGSIVAQKIAGQKKQIEKIELARASLQLLVSADQRPELVMEASGEIGIEAIEQHANVLAKRVAPIEHLFAKRGVAKSARAALPVPALARFAADEIAQLRLEPVVVARSPDRLLCPQVSQEAPNVGEVLHQVVVLGIGAGNIFGQDRKALHDLVQGLSALERIASPASIEVALLDQIGPRPAQNEARSERVAIARAAAQDPPHAWRGIREYGLKPALEALTVEPLFFFFGGHLELRVHASFHRPLAQEVRAKAVDRADARFFQLGQRAVEPESLVFARRRQGPRLLDFRAQAELHFTGRFFGNRHRDDECSVEIAPDAPACLFVDQRFHTLFLHAKRAASSSCFLTRVLPSVS